MEFSRKHQTNLSQGKPYLYEITSTKIGLVLVSLFAMSIASFKLGLSQESQSPLNQTSESDADKPPNSKMRLTVDEARRQAEILHKTMNSTLQMIHDRYYRPDQGLPIPAAVLKDVFMELQQEHEVRLRWLAVEGQAMNVDHKPQTPFENEAVAALTSGKQEYEQTANGVYRRVGSITLSNHCLKCHVPDRKNTKNRTAGLIIAIPIQEK